MILFVTMRPDTLDIRRRLKNFGNLNMEARHFPLARRHFPQVFLSVAGVGLLQRMTSLLSGIFRLRAPLRSLEAKDILYVSALDCLVVAIIARFFWGNRSRLVCEILDVHYLLLFSNAYRPVLRAIERWSLARVDLLVVPTQGNIDSYYYPVLGLKEKVAVVQNKMPTGEATTMPPLCPYTGTWTIGWFGSLRCERSLEILCRTAAVMGDRVKVLMAGVCKLPIDQFREAITPYPNIVYLGEFDAAKDAARLYSQVHITYALHYEPPLKSKWALAVRILEGGAYGRPAIARADSDMGRYLAEHGIGWGVQEPAEDVLPEFLTALTFDEYLRAADRVRQQRQLFVGEDQIASALERVVAKQQEPAAAAV